MSADVRPGEIGLDTVSLWPVVATSLLGLVMLGCAEEVPKR